MPDLTPHTKEKREVRVRKGAVPSETRQAAVQRLVSETLDGISRGLGGVALDVSVVDCEIKTSMTTLKDGKWLLPDDVDEERTEEIAVRFRVTPQKEVRE